MSDVLDWRVFLVEQPPGSPALVENVAEVASGREIGKGPPSLPDLPLECDGDCKCERYCTGAARAQGQLFAEVFSDPNRTLKDLGIKVYDHLLIYTCPRCQRVVKSFAIRFKVQKDAHPYTGIVTAEKLGEWPSYSPPTIAKLITLIGPDKEFFLKGRRAEFAGLGIGAFGYYRRVVERQRDRLLDEVLRVARRVSASQDIINSLELAKANQQFSGSLANISVPERLFINNYNPLTVLHKALSQGLHNESDEACLLLATTIRTVLIALADRMAAVLKDERELNEAVNRLMHG